MSQFALKHLKSGHLIPVGEYLVVGSDPSLPYSLQNCSAEQRHMRIEKHGENYVIKDLRSVSGTFVNNTRITEAWLQPGDEIRLGDTHLLVEDLNRPQKVPVLTSKNSLWQNQLQRLGAIANSETPVLLLGPSGTGKEVLSQSIHQHSRRSQGPFVSVNCSALTETLVESELFGHVKGSFTGAIGDRKGAFESARGGTLFLDEIGDLPYGLQAKLLRALENNEIRPVGADRVIQTNVRIIAATHQNLADKIQSGEFRLDLYYRLAVATIITPALKNRMEDFDEILMSFARKLKVRFSFAAIQRLKDHTWPGNIRELKNTVSRAAAYFPQQSIEENQIIDILDPVAVSEASRTPGASDIIRNSQPVIREIEKDMILKRLAANHGNQRKTAADLRMPKSTLHDRIRLYEINPKEFQMR